MLMRGPTSHFVAFRSKFAYVFVGVPCHNGACVSAPCAFAAKARLHENHRKTQGSGTQSLVKTASAIEEIAFRSRSEEENGCDNN
jgi:hypothetical protein